MGEGLTVLPLDEVEVAVEMDREVEEVCEEEGEEKEVCETGVLREDLE